MNRTWTAELTALLAAAIAAAAYFGDLPLVIVVGVIVLMFAAGWPYLLDLPSPQSASAVIALGSLAAVVAVVIRAEQPLTLWLPVTLGLALLLAFLREMFRKNGRASLVESVTGTVSGIIIGAFGSGWIAASRTGVANIGIGGDTEALSVVLVGAGALAVACAIAGIPLPKAWRTVAMIVSATVAAGILAWVLPAFDYVSGALIGLMVGILISAVRSMYEELLTSRKLPGVLAAISLPVVSTGMAIYIIGLVGSMFTQ